MKSLEIQSSSSARSPEREQDVLTRKRSNAFLRKPLPLAAEQGDDDTATTTDKRAPSNAVTVALSSLTTTALQKSSSSPFQTILAAKGDRKAKLHQKSGGYSAVPHNVNDGLGHHEEHNVKHEEHYDDTDTTHDKDDEKINKEQQENSSSFETKATPIANTLVQEEHKLQRHLSLLDLIAIGVGGTIGTGLFVLAGLVAHQYAGPATVLSWLVAGFAACLSGCCYAELSARIPLAGSAYAYSYVAMGELPAVLAAACLSLEYVAAAAAVARSWGDKCALWITDELHDDDEQDWIHKVFDANHRAFNPLACLISTAVVTLLLYGVKESKRATNFVTGLKVAVVTFMVVAGFFFVQPSNWTPFLPVQFGVAGVLRGATGTFFGYLGYDQVCCLGGEVKNPKENLPRAILGVLVGVTVLYMTATLALTGMQPYQNISPISGFPAAFYALDANLAGQITALGEILTLPIVVLITIMAQPRLQYAMAMDGLLPAVFKEMDGKGNLFKGSVIAGGLMIVIATFIPFHHLNDMISCAVLSALSITDSSLILVWHESPDPDSNLAAYLVLGFNVAALVTGMLLKHFTTTSWIGTIVTVIPVGSMVFSSWALYTWCPRSDTFGGHHHRHEQPRHRHQEGGELILDDGYFKTPLVPFWPCVAIFVNWYLIAQLEAIGIGLFLAFLALAILYYFVYAAKHSVGNTIGWPRQQHVDDTTSDDHARTCHGNGMDRNIDTASNDHAEFHPGNVTTTVGLATLPLEILAASGHLT